MAASDHYAALGLASTATPEQIKHAYRKLARKYHPDVSKEADAEARFKRIASAYETLHDTARRRSYDDERRQEQAQAAFSARARPQPARDFASSHPPQFDRDFFESLFGQHSAGEAPARDADVHASLLIDLRDAYRGAQRHIVLQAQAADAQHATIPQRQLEIRIPKGIRAGQSMRLAGQGLAARPGTAAGDLYVKIEFAADAVFRVDERDVHTELAITPWESALGARITAPTPDGQLQVTIPAGSRSGHRLRLKGQGIPSSPPGDLYITLSIICPPATTLTEQEAYRTLAASFTHFAPRQPTPM
jgi:curved DNA-binding protein